MPKVELEVTVVLRVKSSELRLIRAALGGRLKPEQRREASELDLELAHQTVAQTRSKIGEVEKLAKNIGERDGLD